jgi:hypothetical protein
MAEYIKDKYLVLKTEDIAKLPNTKRVLMDEIITMIKDIRRAQGKPGLNEYYVCNITEPYAKTVWEAISLGEDNKITPCGCGGNTQPILLGNRWLVYCDKCGKLFGEIMADNTSRGFVSKEQAIAAWNIMKRHQQRKEADQ